MIARMVNAIPTANTNLAGFGFGAMDPLLAPGTLLVVVPVLVLPSGKRCELIHTSVLVQKMMMYRKAANRAHGFRVGDLIVAYVVDLECHGKEIVV
jgi:hypothetical protein